MWSREKRTRGAISCTARTEGERKEGASSEKKSTRGEQHQRCVNATRDLFDCGSAGEGAGARGGRERESAKTPTKPCSV